MDSIIDFTKLRLTKKQVRYLLFIVEAEGSLKDCAMLLGVSETSLCRLLTRVEKKFPGFRGRLKKMRRVTLTDGHCSMPKEIPVGDLHDLEDLKYPKDYMRDIVE